MFWGRLTSTTGKKRENLDRSFHVSQVPKVLLRHRCAPFQDKLGMPAQYFLPDKMAYCPPTGEGAVILPTYYAAYQVTLATFFRDTPSIFSKGVVIKSIPCYHPVLAYFG